jgi:hypothetical protein
MGWGVFEAICEKHVHCISFVAIDTQREVATSQLWTSKQFPNGVKRMQQTKSYCITMMLCKSSKQWQANRQVECCQASMADVITVLYRV